MRSIETQAARILVADPINETRASLVEALSSSGLCCLEAPDGNRAWSCFRSGRPDLVVSALQLPGLNGLDLLARVRRASDVPFVIQIPRGELPAAVQAVRGGAAEVIALPCDMDELTSRIKGLIATAPGHAAPVAEAYRFLGRSNDATRIRTRIRALADLKISVLFQGERGTGRTHAARALATADGTDIQHFVRICAIDGARRHHDYSTKVLYLAEIDQFSKADQVYWHERIEASERGAPNSPRRVLASTSSDLDGLGRSMQFDKGLAQCLLRFVVRISPLRQRVEDIPPLVEKLGASIAARVGRRQVVFSAPALRVLQAQSWPENVAQLSEVIEKLVAFAPDGLVTKPNVIDALAEFPASVDSLRQMASRRQRDELVALLDATSGNLAEAARRMNMSRGAIIYRAQKFGLLGKRVRTVAAARRPRGTSMEV